MTISGLPWRISDDGIMAVDAAVIVNNNGSEVLGTSEWIRIDVSDLDAIIRAVNAHDALVAALETAKRMLDGAVLDDRSGFAKIDAALALARGGK